MEQNLLDSAIKFGAGRYRQGKGVLEECGSEISRFGRRAFLIAGPAAYHAVEKRLIPGLQKAGISYTAAIYRGYCSYEAAMLYAKKALESGCDEIVGIGGGKIMDFAKAVGEAAGLGVVNIPTSIATCAAFTSMSVMYTENGAMKDNWRFEHEVDAVLVDLDVIVQCPSRYAAAGILDAMAKYVEIPNGTKIADPEHMTFDLYTAYRMSEYTYDYLKRYGKKALEDIQNGWVSREVEYVTFLNIAITGVIANITRSFNQSALAHMVYYGARTYFEKETRDFLHGEIVAVGLLAQLYYNCQPDEILTVKEFLQELGMPVSLQMIGITGTKKQLQILEDYLKCSPYVGTDEERERLGRSIDQMMSKVAY